MLQSRKCSKDCDEIVGGENVVVDPEKVEPYGADAVKEKFPPEAVVFPESTEQMVEILKLANEYLFPVTARGGGVGYTGGAVPIDGGIVIGTDRMNKIIEINADDLYVDLPAGTNDIRTSAGGREAGIDVRTRSRQATKIHSSAATSPRTPAGCGRRNTA